MPPSKQSNAHRLIHTVRELGLRSIKLTHKADRAEAEGDDEKAASLREQARKATQQQHVANQEWLESLGDQQAPRLIT